MYSAVKIDIENIGASTYATPRLVYTLRVIRSQEI